MNTSGHGVNIGNGAASGDDPRIDPLTGVRYDPSNRLLMCVSI